MSRTAWVKPEIRRSTFTAEMTCQCLCSSGAGGGAGQGPVKPAP